MSSRLGIRSKSDDNESVAGSVASLLDCYGHHAAAACDGESALGLLRIGAFEITFIDENLPDIKGSAVAWSLKETPKTRWPHQKIPGIRQMHFWFSEWGLHPIVKHSDSALRSCDGKDSGTRVPSADTQHRLARI